MKPNVEPPRRWFGLLFIALAGGMVIWGLTALESRLSGKDFVVYWTLCFLFTGLAVVVSLFESLRVRRFYERQERELFDQTMREIQSRDGAEDQS